MFPILLIGAGVVIAAMVAAASKKTEQATAATPGATGVPAPGSVWQYQFTSSKLILPSDVPLLKETYAGMAQMAGQTLIAFSVSGNVNNTVIAVVKYGQNVAPVQIGQQVALGNYILTLVSATPAPINA